MMKFPVLVGDIDINEFMKQNIKVSKIDWDSYETSWDFKKHPMV